MPSTFSLPARARRAPGAALLAAVFLGCAGNPEHGLIAAEIEKGVNAVRNKDIDAYMDQVDNAALSPDSATAERARVILRANVLSDWNRTTTRSMHVKVDSITAARDSAIVTTSLHWDRIVERPLRTDTVISDVTNREIWRRTARGWRPFKVLSRDGTNTTNGRTETVGKGR